jgi:hypothetical protein
MKITLTIELDIPDECSEWSDGEIAQNVFDTYVAYVPKKHIQDVTQWIVEHAKTGNPTAKIIADHHELWYDITKNPKWSFTRN